MRGAEQHLSADEIRQLADGAAHRGGGELEDAMRHLDACVPCRLRMLLPEEQVAAGEKELAQRSRERTAACPPDGAWLEFAAGIMPQEQRQSHLEHAAKCAHCGSLLKAAIEDVGLELTPEEESKVTSLGSATMEWQGKVARKITGAPAPTLPVETKPAPKSSGFLFWPRWAFAFAAFVLVVGAGWWAWLQFRAPSVEALLAEAYTERRTIEIRIPRARYAPLRVERGTSGSTSDQPQALLDANGLISRELKTHPEDPKWLQAKGRADLLEFHYDPAIQTLQRVLDVRPDSPSVMIDLASAYYERASANPGREVDYGTAIEYLGRALAKTPDDPIALFNRAIICERFSLFTQALDDWQHYLRVDSNGPWADDARRRLEALRERLGKREHGMSEPFVEPTDLARLRLNDALRLKVDERIEDYLQIALVDWLPNAYPENKSGTGLSTIYQAALGTLARITARQHGDLWLTEFLSAASSEALPPAIIELSSAIKANNLGDNEAARENAIRAVRLFRVSGNQAGILRAQVEYLFASHRGQQGRSCLEAASDLGRRLEDQRYLWLRTQFHLEQGTCYWLLGNLGKARELYTRAAQEAEAGGYNEIYLRTQDHLSGLDGISGDLRTSWNRTQRGLARFWSGRYPPVRGYNFYYNLYEFSRLTNQPRLQMVVWRDALALSDSFSDKVLRAMAHSGMASAAVAAGQPAVAEQELVLAAQFFATSPQIKSTRIARLEAEIRLADVETVQGREQQALAHLRDLEPEISQLWDSSLPLLFYTTLGVAEVHAGDSARAEAALSSAVRFSEQQMQSLRDEKSRIEWNRYSSAAYRNLVQQKLRQGDVYGSLELWEWYRGAAQRMEGSADPVPSINWQSFDRFGSQQIDPHEVTSHLSTISRETILSYAMLPDGLAIWVYDNRGVFARWIESTPRTIEARVARFRNICSDPQSDQADFGRVAHNLYDLLIAPIQQELPSGRSLVIEADEGLAKTPFEALIDPQGHFLSDHAPVVISLGFYYWKDSRTSFPIMRGTNALVVAVPTSRASVGGFLPPLLDAVTEGEMVARYFQSPRILPDKEATNAAISSLLPWAQVFHFAGHAITSVKQTGLLLSDALLSSASLGRTQLTNMQLAVLSACDTQDGSEGGLYDSDGMVRTFLRFGVPHVIGSRWSVYSAPTQQFMKFFYQALLAGNSVPNAIQLARAEVRARAETSHPYYWAAFTAFGVV